MLFKRGPHGKYIKKNMRSFKSNENIHKKIGHTK